MSSLSARLEITDHHGRPTRAFIQAWSAAGALIGLPPSMILTDPAGAPSRPFLDVLRAAFPANDLRPGDRIIVARRPTLRFLALWAKSTG